MMKRWVRVVAGAVLLTACSGDSDSSSGESTGRNVYGECPSDDMSETCTGEAAYDNCVQDACDDTFKSCFGTGYASGSYGGACGSVVTCMFGCACGDTACELACAQNASSECITCYDEADACVEQSGCEEPQCSTGSSTGGSGGSSGSAGGSSGGGTGGSTASVCPYTVASLSCTTACDQLREIAAKCKDDPSVPASIKVALEAASQGTGAACNVTCQADSQSYENQWKCFQGVPVSAECSAIAGCTLTNCP